MSAPLTPERRNEIERLQQTKSGMAFASVTADAIADLLAEIDRLNAEREWIGDEATEAFFLPTLNGAVTADLEGAMQEGRQLANALQRIGHRIHPERWIDPDEAKAMREAVTFDEPAAHASSRPCPACGHQQGGGWATNNHENRQ